MRGRKIADFQNFETNENDWYNLKEHEILNKKMYYNNSLTQTQKEIQPFEVKKRGFIL